MSASSVPIADAVLPQELCQWAVKSMNFVPKNVHGMKTVPTVEDFQLVCRGQMNDIWRFVIARVHSCQTVRNVRGNLMLKQLQESRGYTVRYKAGSTLDPAAAELYDKRCRVMSDIKLALASSNQLERDIEQLQRQILATDGEYQAALSHVGDLNHKRLLLNAYAVNTTDERQRIDELARRVNQKCQKMSRTPCKASELPQIWSQTSAAGGGGGSVVGSGSLETASVRAVREACELIASFLHRLLQGGFEQEEQAMTRVKDEMWNSVNAILAEYSASEILTSLCVCADNTAISLQHKTAAVDVCKEAEQLRFKYESAGNWSDLSTQPSVLQNIHQILQASQAAIFARFIETEKHRNNSSKMQRRLIEASELLDTLLRRQFTNPSTLQLARTLLETETCIASTRATMRALESECVEFDVKIRQGTAEKEILYAKYQKIQDFKNLADKKQNLIRVLVKQNMNSQARLHSQQSENVSYAERSLCPHESNLQQMASKLTDFVATENDAFHRLSLPLLPSVTLENQQKLAVVDMSIYKLGTSPLLASSQLIGRLLLKLDMPYISCDSVLERIAELRTESNSTRLALKLQTMSSRKADGKTVEYIRELCERVAKHDKEAEDRLLPVLQKRLTAATETLTDCLHVKDSTLDWWDQPAQLIVPWVTVDGMSFKQWRDRWTVSATQLRALTK